jgi:hypothetical protein
VPDDHSDERSLTAALAEFQALRGEIVQRIQLQQVLLGLSITALGALLSVALAGNTAQASLLLAAPFVTSALGFGYSDQGRRINLLGAYVKDVLWPFVRSLTDSRLSSWEEHFADKVSPQQVFQAGLTSAYIVTLFVVSPLGADFYAAAALHWQLTSGEWVLFATGLAATILYSIYALAVALRHGIEQSSGVRSPPAST